MKTPYIITDYAELREWPEQFVKTDISPHRLRRTGARKVRSLQAGDGNAYAIFVNGRLVGFDLFNKLLNHPGALFLFDDTRGLLKERECVSLLMQLLEHRANKEVQWNTSRAALQSFRTTSRAVILINKMDEDDDDLDPLFSRTVAHIKFVPSKLATHEYVAEWYLASDRKEARQDIYAFISHHLYLIPQMDVRYYTNSLAIFDMPGEKWKNMLLQQ